MHSSGKIKCKKTEGPPKDKANCKSRSHGTFDHSRVIELSFAVINVILTFCPFFFFLLIYFCQEHSDRLMRNSSLLNYNQKPPCRLWHLYHAECTCPTQYLMKEIWQMFLLPSHVPPPVSSPWKHVTESVYPHFPHLSLFCDMMASCRFEIRRWRGKKRIHLWCAGRKTSKEVAAPFDLEVIRWVIVGWGGFLLVNSWQLNYCHLAHGHQWSGNPNTLLSSHTCPLKDT